MVLFSELPYDVLMKIFSYCDTLCIIRNFTHSCTHLLEAARDTLGNKIIITDIWTINDFVKLFRSLELLPKHIIIQGVREPLKKIVMINDIIQSFHIHNRTDGSMLTFRRCICDKNEKVFYTSNLNIETMQPMLLKSSSLVIKKCCPVNCSTIIMGVLYGDLPHGTMREASGLHFSNETYQFKKIVVDFATNCNCSFNTKAVDFLSFCVNNLLMAKKLHTSMSEIKFVNVTLTPNSLVTMFSAISTDSLTVVKLLAYNVIDENLTVLSSSAKNLKVLHLYQAGFITSCSVKPLLVSLTHLQSFIVTGNLQISPVEWQEVFGGKPGNITHVGLDECLVDDSVLFSLAYKCPDLRKLTLSGCRSDEAILTSDSVMHLLTTCTKLRHLDLNFTDRELEKAWLFGLKNFDNLIIKYQSIN